MNIPVQLPEADPGPDTTVISVRGSDTIEDVQYGLVAQYIADITDEEMEIGVWRNRYYIYLVDGDVERPNPIAPTLEQTVSEIGLSSGQRIALDFQENNPTEALYVCPDCSGNSEVRDAANTREHTARPAPTHDCGCEMKPHKNLF